MNPNPSEQLYAAIELATRALAGMYESGADREALEGLAITVADLKHEHDKLPDLIQEHERRECETCRLGQKDLNPACDLIGDSIEFDIHCSAKSVYQCPVVRACGFRDPKDPLDSVPAFLRRQTA